MGWHSLECEFNTYTTIKGFKIYLGAFYVYKPWISDLLDGDETRD